MASIEERIKALQKRKEAADKKAELKKQLEKTRKELAALSTRKKK